MFKAFQDNSRNNVFNGFPTLIFEMNNEAYGFSGCTFWLDAAYGTNTQTDLSSISSWITKISSFRFIQATAANQPRFILSDPSFNNLPTIEFYSDSRRLFSENSFGLNLNQTICWIAKVDIENTLNYVAGVKENIGDNIGFIQSGNNSAGPQSPGSIQGNFDFYGIQGTLRSTNSTIVVMTSSNIIMNGINQTTTGTAKWNQFSLSAIGGSRSVNNSGTGLIGRIGEFLIFNKKLSQNDCIELSNRLNTKYAIY